MTHNTIAHVAVVPFPDELVQQYLADATWNHRSLAESFRAAAERLPDRPR
jgi:non-ribosomal peptide synthetase component E (peptide arylation enzyme)